MLVDIHGNPLTTSRAVVTAGWDDVPHLSETAKAEMIKTIHPHYREARTKGIPSLGAGAIYPIPWDEVSCEGFKIPNHWRRCFGLDVGSKTAAIYGAYDPEDDVVYCYSEYYASDKPALFHANAMSARGLWIPGVIDPSANNRSPRDGERIIADYRSHKLLLSLADNSVTAGIDLVWERLETGRLRFFRSLVNTKREYQYYRRKLNEKTGVVKIHKMNDHLMDALRYMIVSGLRLAKAKPIANRGLALPPKRQPVGRGGY